MKRLIFLLAIVLSAIQLQAQTKYFTKTGVINFKAGTAMEDIDAINKSTVAIFDPGNGDIEFAVLNKGFEFKRGLMQEHFNENYMESDKYPKTVFKGRCEDLSKIDLTRDGTYPVLVKGKITIHGAQKEIEVPGTFKVVNGAISSEAVFKVLVEDYKITIPGAVKDKISPEVEIRVVCQYKPM
jgi:hypothetical protein